MTHKIKIAKRSRSGNNRLKTIVVIKFLECRSIEQEDETIRTINSITPDKNGIIWLAARPYVSIKVYPIK